MYVLRRSRCAETTSVFFRYFAGGYCMSDCSVVLIAPLWPLGSLGRAQIEEPPEQKEGRKIKKN